MKVLICVSEAVPFAKTGGLADVAGALPSALAELGCEVRLVLPRYRAVPLETLRRAGTVTVNVGEEPVSGTIFETTLDGSLVPVWFVDQPGWFDREGLYGEGGADYPDNLTRFTFFCRAVLEWLNRQPWRPDVLHCNDWQTALIPVLATAEAPRLVPTLLTIHNLAYQGLFPPEQYQVTGLPPSLFTPRGLEFWSKVNVLKGGLIFSDILNTVSETYAQEIQTELYGAGLDGVLRDRSDDLFGILNGVDYGSWDPATDPLIPATYTLDDLSGKRACKKHLQRAFRLPVGDVPLIGMVTRLADQKGLDLVIEVIEEILRTGTQFVVLGTGEPKYHELFEGLSIRHPRQVGVRLGFDNPLAHQIEAGADMFLMPSRYEPSGLNQLYSLRYGTVPIVRRTGGLADSIVDLTPKTLADGTANGFVFDEYTGQALLEAIRRALRAFGDRATWGRLQEAGMRADFSWARSARKYLELYERAKAKAAALPHPSTGSGGLSPSKAKPKSGR
jgi:starch synthase